MRAKNTEEATTEIMVGMFKAIDDLPGRRLVDVIDEANADDSDYENIGRSLSESFSNGLNGLLPNMPSPHRVMLTAAINETDWTHLAENLVAYGRKQQQN